LNGVPLEQVLAAPWTWQPGWRYRTVARFQGTGQPNTPSE
jgi:hypothetical protein